MDRLGIPTYLKKMIKIKPQNQLLVYDIEETPLWNIVYDDMLKIKLPPGAVIVDFADDEGLVITRKPLEEIQRIFGECYEAVQRRIGSVGHKWLNTKQRLCCLRAGNKWRVSFSTWDNIPSRLSLVLGIKK